MVRSGFTKLSIACLLVLTMSQGLNAAPRRLKQATGLPDIPDLNTLIQQLQTMFPGLDLQTLVSMIESGQFGATATQTPQATPAPTTQATPTPTIPASPTPTSPAPPTPTAQAPPTPTTQAPPTPTATISPPTPPTSPAVPPSDTVQTQSVSSSPPPASMPPSDPATATPPASSASPPPAVVPPPLSSSDAVPPPTVASTLPASPPAQSVPPTALPTAAVSSPPAASPPAYAQTNVLERATYPPLITAVPPPTASAVPPPSGSVQTQSAEDPRDQPCSSSQRTTSGSSFTCAGFNGYYCNGNANGQTGTSTCGGTWRCESISSQPSVYGMLAAYPSSSPNSAIGGYCYTSDDCSAGQFCDKSPQTNWAGDRPYGNCVAYLAQGCKG